MNISCYLKNIGASQAWFGKQLVPRASQGLVSQWARGVTRVTLDYALQIERLTNGAITPFDCAQMFSPRQERSTLTTPKAPT